MAIKKKEVVTIENGNGSTIEFSGDEYRELIAGRAESVKVANDASLEYEGFAIVIADRAWVYVGDVRHDGQWCIIRNAKNIRRWGTERGLGELAKEGPKTGTQLDDYGLVRVPNASVISIIDSDKNLWK